MTGDTRRKGILVLYQTIFSVIQRKAAIKIKNPSYIYIYIYIYMNEIINAARGRKSCAKLLGVWLQADMGMKKYVE